MAGDDIDPFEIKGNLSVVANVDPLEFGDGSIDVDGNINLNGNIGENTLGNGITLKDIKTFTLKNQIQPSSPTSGETVFHVDISTGLLRSIDSSSTVTTYQPTNSKGDLVSHNGVTQVRLPIGTNGYVLTADASSSSGLKWAEAGTGSGGDSETSIVSITTNLKTLLSNSYTEVFDLLTGPYYNKVYNQINKGPSANFFYAKSRQSIQGGIVRFNNCPGISSLERLRSQWLENEEPEIKKTGSEYDGNYENHVMNTSNPENSVTLAGTTWSSISTNTTGNFVFAVTNDFEGPVAIFYVTKNVASYNGASINRIVNSPGTGPTRLRLRWLSNSDLQIRKTTTSHDGEYFYTDLLTDLSLTQSFTVTLSGTAESSFDYTKFQRVSATVSITPNIADGPSAIFTISKNDKTVDYSVIRVVSSPGLTSNEKLNLVWNNNDQLKVFKDGTGYDGDYTVSILV